jgi:manganese transport protein
MKGLFKSVGPAIVVAAVVLGPGSILTSSKVGAQFGFAPLLVLAGAVILMIGMVALAARLGVSYEGSLCDELALRLGRWVAVAIGLVVFALVALFQASNNIAVVGGLEPLIEGSDATEMKRWVSVALLAGLNLLVIWCVYGARDLYRTVETLMKVLVALMVAAFLINFIVVLVGSGGKGAERTPDEGKADWLPLLAMVGTTFSIAGAFYQAYLVKERGWTLNQAREGLTDSVVGIAVLGGVTAVILMTSAIVFHGRIDVKSLASVGDVARQLEPLFGASAKFVFCLGIFAGAISSFMVNAMVGGTILSDGLGMGSRMEERWPKHFTTLALVVGMVVGGVGLLKGKESIVYLITLAQALTVLGMPALALALIYLGTRKELTGERAVPRWLICMAWISLAVALVLAVRLGGVVWGTLSAARG